MPSPDLVPDFSRTMRLLSANVVIGFVAGPLLLVALVATVVYLYDHSPRSLRDISYMAQALLVHIGYRWAFISTLYCALVWLPIWLTQSFHLVFRKATSAALAGTITGLIAFALLYAGLFNQRLMDTPGVAFAGAISGMCIFILSHLFRERPDLQPSIPADDETTID